MTGLLGPDGKPIGVSTYKNKKSPPPPTGEKYGQWGGPHVDMFQLPGGGAIQFDLNMLDLSDYRQMTDHYQINSSLTLLTFLMHQMEWRIICEDKKQQDFYTEELKNIWTPLVRSKSTAFWSGFSPNVLQWENDVADRRIRLGKVKDLVPELSEVKWRTVDGAGTNKINLYDGIKVWGASSEIPVDNTYWYPLLMKNGDYRGTKLLRSAFQPWFFSILVHLFANRYYERFGEPTPVGRAPYDDDIRYQGAEMRGNQAMELILQNLRNRSVVVLPNDKSQHGDETTMDFDYQIEYLESQMRGADFERYLTRLDEEMSLALFTPILMMRTADVGSYNLGTQHSIVYQWMLNALGGDWKYYIDWYILRPLRNFNFGENAPMPKIKFKQMGAKNEELVHNIIPAMISKGQIRPDIDQLGELAGLTLTQVRGLTAPPEEPGQTDPSADPDGDDAGEDADPVNTVVRKLRERVNQQIRNAFRRDNVERVEFSLGFQSQFESALREVGKTDAATKTKNFYESVDYLLRDLQAMHLSESAFMGSYDSAVNWKVTDLLKSGE
jgi:hypothetical protein